MQPNSFIFNDALISETPASKKTAYSGTEKVWRRILFVLVVILAFEAIWLCVIRPCMPLSGIELNGIPGIERDVVLHYAGITSETSFYSVNAAKMERVLEELVMVESAEVVKQFPSRIYIKLNPRIPVAVSLTYVDGKMIPLFIDKHGVVCKMGLNDSESRMHMSNLPIISGLIFDNASVGTRLPVILKKFLESIERINMQNSLLLSSFSEIRIHEKLYDGFELVLYHSSSNTKIRTGAELNEEMLKYIMLMIDVLYNEGVDVDEIDFRTGTASYKLKEAFFG